MSCRTYIIDLTEVKCIVGINTNVDDYKLKSGHDRAHMQARERLGDEVYDALIAAIAADNTLAGAGNAKWRNLIAEDQGELKNYIAWLTYYYSIVRLHSEADRGGFFAKSGQGYEALDGKALALHVADAKDAFQLYERALLKWIADEGETQALPEVTSPTDSDQPQFIGGFVTVPSRYYNIGDEGPEDTNTAETC